MADPAPIQVEGVRELIRALNELDPALRKELGQRNKAIGQGIIDRAFPKPETVGAGAGAKPRASAAANVLRIMAGGTHRTKHFQQWGKKYRERDRKRPYIRRAAEDSLEGVEEEYMQAILDVAKKAGFKTEKG